MEFNTLRPRRNDRQFADDIFRCIFMNENAWISIDISLKFVPKDPINNIRALVQIMAGRWTGATPLSEALMDKVVTHICATRPQWVNAQGTHESLARNLPRTSHMNHIFRHFVYVFMGSLSFWLKICCMHLNVLTSITPMWISAPWNEEKAFGRMISLVCKDPVNICSITTKIYDTVQPSQYIYKDTIDLIDYWTKETSNTCNSINPVLQ